jgi:hypothetical protein
MWILVFTGLALILYPLADILSPSFGVVLPFRMSAAESPLVYVASLFFGFLFLMIACIQRKK